MAKRKKKYMKGMTRDAMAFTTSGIAMGVGAQVAQGTGAVGTTAAGGLGAMAGMMPVMGTVTGAGYVLKATKQLMPRKRRRR